MKKFLAIILALVMCFSVCACGEKETDDDESLMPDVVQDMSNNTEDDAINAAYKIVRDRLKSPATARFSNSEASLAADSCTWTVSGYVDAQNGFGALIRAKYTVKFTLDVLGNYSVKSCEID